MSFTQHTVPDPPWPAVHEVVSSGQFMAAEWVHDPVVFSCAYAGQASQAAIQCPDALAAGKHFAWLVASTYRVAVVIETGILEGAEPPGAGVPSDQNRQYGIKGVLGTATSLAKEFKERHVLSPSDGSMVETWWEWPANAITGYSAVEWGRTIAF